MSMTASCPADQDASPSSDSNCSPALTLAVDVKIHPVECDGIEKTHASFGWQKSRSVGDSIRQRMLIQRSFTPSQCIKPYNTPMAPAQSTADGIGIQSLASSGPVDERDSEAVTRRQALINEVVQGDIMSVLARRPGRISVSVHRPSTSVSLGFRLERGRTGAIGIREKHVGSGVMSMCNPSALLPGSDHALTFFQPGDALESINDCNFSIGDKQISDVSRYLLKHDGLTTLVVSTEDQIRTGHQGNLLCQAFALTGASADSSIINQSNEAPPLDSSNRGAVSNMGITFIKRLGMLQIHRLSPDGWLGKNSALRQGDLVIGINDKPCLDIDVDDAHAFLETKAHFSPYVSITTIAATPGQRRWAKVRKAAAGAGGGTMIGVGAVIMATPLHPLGHAMAIGGVAVLGTEFESPKRALKKTSDRAKEMLAAKGRWATKGGQRSNDDDAPSTGNAAGGNEAITC